MIETQALTRRFGEIVAVDQLSLHVPDGAILALLGHNGAGKTTTVRMLTGLLAPSSGQAVVAGCDVRRDPAAVRARVGLVTDVPGLYEQMTAPAYLDFFGKIYGMDPDQRTRRIDALLTLFDLKDRRAERMVGFSRGMKQKVALARALLHEPPVLFLDEPTAGLDPLAARAVRDLIVGLKHASRSIILCTHDLDEADRLADEVAILQHGRLVAADAPAALRAGATTNTRVRVELAAPCLSAIAELEAIDGVLTPLLTPNGSATTSATLIEYHTAQPRRVNPLVVARLVAIGAQVVAVNGESHSLEDVYAAMIGQADLANATIAGK